MAASVRHTNEDAFLASKQATWSTFVRLATVATAVAVTVLIGMAIFLL